MPDRVEADRRGGVHRRSPRRECERFTGELRAPSSASRSRRETDLGRRSRSHARTRPTADPGARGPAPGRVRARVAVDVAAMEVGRCPGARLRRPRARVTLGEEGLDRGFSRAQRHRRRWPDGWRRRRPAGECGALGIVGRRQGQRLERELVSAASPAPSESARCAPSANACRAGSRSAVVSSPAASERESASW